MKKIILGLILSFSLVLVGCSKGLESLSVVEAMNKDLIEDLQEESREIMASQTHVELVELGLTSEDQDLEIKFSLDQEADQAQLEGLGNLIMEKLKYKLASLNSRVIISWDYGEGQKTAYYTYVLDQNMNVLLEENYLEEKN